MAEMRRPRDFWKGALCAQLFCFLIYMIFGIVNYTRQGQYSSILPGIDFANQALSLATNSILIASTFVACVLYGNIGVKVFYENVLRAYFKAPSLLSNKGRLIWAVTVCCYWIIAWVIGSAIPNITALVTLVGAACILQFTYTFPPILLLGHWMQMDAMKADNPWTPGVEPGSNRIDTWKDKSRWIRGFKRYWYVKVFLVSLPPPKIHSSVYDSLLNTHAICLVPHVPWCVGKLRTWPLRWCGDSKAELCRSIQRSLLVHCP